MSSLVEIDPVVRYFVIISPWKNAWPFLEINVCTLHPRMRCAKFGCNWPIGSGENCFKNLLMYFHYFVIKRGSLHFNNLIYSSPKDDLWFWRKRSFKKSSMYFQYFGIISLWKNEESFISKTWIPFTLGCIVPRLVGSGEDDFSKPSMYFRNFVIIPLGKGQSPSFEQTWIPFTQRWFVPSLVKICSLVLEENFFF